MIYLDNHASETLQVQLLKSLGRHNLTHSKPPVLWLLQFGHSFHVSTLDKELQKSEEWSDQET